MDLHVCCANRNVDLIFGWGFACFHPSLFSHSSSLRAPPLLCHLRSQRKRRSISTKTKTYVKARTVKVQKACVGTESVFLTLHVLYSQRNGYDDDYSVISSRVSSCVKECLQIYRQSATFHSWLSSFSCCQSSRISDESRASRSSRLDLTVRLTASHPYRCIAIQWLSKALYRWICRLMNKIHLHCVEGNCSVKKHIYANLFWRQKIKTFLDCFESNFSGLEWNLVARQLWLAALLWSGWNRISQTAHVKGGKCSHKFDNLKVQSKFFLDLFTP